MHDLYHRGLLGHPVTVPIGHTACTVTVTQLFSKALLDLPAALFAIWEVQAAEAQVELAGRMVTILVPAGRILFQAVTWRGFNHAMSSWEADQHGGLHVVLTKQADSLASWPFVFESMSARANGCAAGDLESVWSEDRAAFEASADALLEAHRDGERTIKAGFVQAVREQMGGLRTLPGQMALLLPGEGGGNLPVLRSAQHLPAVAKLLHAIHQELGVDLARCDDGERPLVSLAACFAAGLASVELRRAEHGLSAVQAVVACAGCGAGEYASAVFAGMLQLKDALQLLQAHAAALEEGATAADDPSAEAGGSPPDGQAVRELQSRQRAVGAVHAALSGMSLRKPRIAAFCGATGLGYGGPAALREALPQAVCSGRPTPQHQQQLRTALEQQGYVGVVDALGAATVDTTEAEL